jgi:sec-independent protein translocase protein TatA
MISEQAAMLGSPMDMAVVMIVALIVFGPKKLPEVGRQLGQAIRELKKLTGDLTESIQNETESIKTAFDTASPYKLDSSPVSSIDQKQEEHPEGYSNSEPMSESKLVFTHSEEAGVIEKAEESSGQAEAASVPLTAVKPKSGDNIQ